MGRKQKTSPSALPVTRPPAEISTPMPDDPQEIGGWWPWLLVLVAVLFNAIALRSELLPITSRNDSTFHLLMIKEASAVIANGGNPLDFWIPQLELGFPQFLYYQHLPHLLLALVHRTLGGAVEAETLFNGTRYLLLVLLPITVAWSLRHMGYSRAAAASGALVSTLASADNRYGIEYNSYVWQGFGMFTQLVGVHLFFVALATLTTSLRTGRGIVTAGVSMAALVLSHLLFGLIFAVAGVVVLLAGATRETWRVRLLRFALAGILALVLASYMIVPFLQSSRTWLSTMPWLESGSRSGRAGRTFAMVATGRLLDDERLPVFTVIAAFGWALCWWRRRELDRIAAVGLLVMLLVYTLRPGSALGALLPAKAGYAGFRFVAGVGIFAVLCVAVAGEALARRLGLLFSDRRSPMAAKFAGPTFAALMLLLLSPALLERWQYHARGHALVVATRRASEDPDLTAAVDLAASRPGRVYAGTRKGWGCEMPVGADLCLTDRLQARQLRLIGNPMQNLALSSGLALNIPDDSAFVYDMLDIRTVVRPITLPRPPFYAPLATFGNYGVFATPSSGIAHYAAVVERRHTDRQDALFAGHLEWIRRGGAARREVIRWDYASAAGSPAPRADCPAGAAFANEAFESQLMAVRVSCPSARGSLAVVFKSMYHPQWRVWVDGRPASPYMVSPGFLAVDVPPGTHDLVAQYRAHPGKVPLLLLGIFTFALVTVLRKRVERLALVGV